MKELSTLMIEEDLVWITYHTTKIEPNCCEVKRQHPIEIKPTPKPINITAKCLLSISICNFSLEK